MPQSSAPIYFSSDYVQAAHPEILQALAQANNRQMPGYGEDALCAEATALLQFACEATDAAVHFVPGGTQANLLVLTAALRPHQAAVAPSTGHISVHETGAIEATGHKVITLPGNQGKLDAGQITALVQAHRNDPTREHTTQPGLVYISCPTEYGTLYTAAELEALHAACRDNGLYLYMDGARLGYGLCAPGADFDLPLLTRCCDAFTVGGTKLGALFGEAIVIPNPALARDFRYIIKQRGAMLAKGWLLGLQFCTLFAGSGSQRLYFRGAQHALDLAGRLAKAIQKLDIPMLMPAATNQIFPILPNTSITKLREKYVFESWEPADETHTAVRFCTAWSTPPAHVDALIVDLEKLMQP